MALAVVQSPHAEGNNVTSITTGAVTTTTGNLLVGCCSSFGAMAATPVSDSKLNVWHHGTQGTTGSLRAQIAEVANGTGGASHTFTLTLTGNGWPNICVSEVSGAATSSVTDGENGSVDASGTSHAAGTITTTSADDILFGVGTASAGTGQTNDVDYGAADVNVQTSGTRQSIIAAHRIVSATGSYGYTWTSSGSTAAITRVAAFKAAAGGTTYAGSVSESGSAADAVGGALVLGASAVETGTAADSLGGALTLAAALAETGSAAETQGGALALVGALAESATAADSQGGVILLGGGLSEAGSLLDVVGGGLVLAGAIAEAGSLTDSPSAFLLLLGTIAESGFLLDLVGSGYQPTGEASILRTRFVPARVRARMVDPVRTHYVTKNRSHVVTLH